MYYVLIPYECMSCTMYSGCPVRRLTFGNVRSHADGLQKLIPHDCIRAVHGHFNVIETRMSMREMVVVHVTRQRADGERPVRTSVRQARTAPRKKNQPALLFLGEPLQHTPKSLGMYRCPAFPNTRILCAFFPQLHVKFWSSHHQFFKFFWCKNAKRCQRDDTGKTNLNRRYRVVKFMQPEIIVQITKLKKTKS